MQRWGEKYVYLPNIFSRSISAPKFHAALSGLEQAGPNVFVFDSELGIFAGCPGKV